MVLQSVFRGGGVLLRAEPSTPAAELLPEALQPEKLVSHLLGRYSVEEVE
jgi:hypothetical protein